MNLLTTSLNEKIPVSDNCLDHSDRELRFLFALFQFL